MVNVLKIRNDFKYLLLYLFFLSVTTARFFLESRFSNFIDNRNLIFHHHYWFLFVFLLFLINFRFFLKLKPDETVWTALLSPVLFLPVIYNLYAGAGQKMALDYLSPVDIIDYFYDVFTFMLFSDINRPISVELIAITVSIFIFSYHKSSEILRSLVCAVSCYLSLIVLGGTALIASENPDFNLFVIRSTFRLQSFLTLLYSGAAFTAAAFLFYDRLHQFFSETRRLSVFAVTSIILGTAANLLIVNPSLFDRLLVIPHCLIIALFITVLLFLKKNTGIKILFLIFSIGSATVLYLNLYYKIRIR